MNDDIQDALADARRFLTLGESALTLGNTERARQLFAQVSDILTSIIGITEVPIPNQTAGGEQC